MNCILVNHALDVGADDLKSIVHYRKGNLLYLICCAHLTYFRDAHSLFKCSTFWKTEDEVGGGMAGLAGDADTYPYVSFTINLV